MRRPTRHRSSCPALWIVVSLLVACGGEPPSQPPDDLRPALFDDTLGRGFLIFLPPSPKRPGTPRQLFEHVLSPLLAKLGFEDEGLAEQFHVPSDAALLPQPELERLISWICASPEARDAILDRRLCERHRRRPETNSRPSETIPPELEAMLRQLERTEVELYFPQVVRWVVVESTGERLAWVPIEHAGVFALGHRDERPRILQGRVFPNYRIVNRVLLEAEQAIRYGADPELGDGNCLLQGAQPARADLLLLPVAATEELDTLRFAYRLQTPVSQCWIDAEDGTTLFDSPLAAEGADDGSQTSPAEALVYHRSPATGSLATARARVDPATEGAFTLSRQDMLRIVPPDGVEPLRLAQAPGTSPAEADFRPAQGEAPACLDGLSDPGWQFVQADLYATLYRQIETLRASGLFEPFPDPPLDVELVADGYKAEVKGRAMRFGFDPEAQGEGCPEIPGLRLGAAQDHTVVAHELGHLATRRLTLNRPPDWCYPSTGTSDTEGSSLPACPVPDPLKAEVFHDFADVWANTLEGTPCWGDWVGRNLGETGSGEDCAEPAADAWSMPRLAKVDVPFEPAQPRNHFPEGRCDTQEPGQLCSEDPDSSLRGPYSDGQLAATALWQLRQGLAARRPVVGRLQFLVRLGRALRHFGWSGWQCGAENQSIYTTCDREVYLSLSELELQLARQWADPLTLRPATTPGAELFNEIPAAFAKVGIFMIPAASLVASPDDTDFPLAGDAVIDLAAPPSREDGNEAPREQWLAGGDHLLRDGPPPTFEVWTGPRYLLGEDGQAWLRPGFGGAPCNRCYRVELATDAEFRHQLFASPWTEVSTDPSEHERAQCWGSWRPSNEVWRQLSTAREPTAEHLYYRVTTHTPSVDPATGPAPCSDPDRPETVRESTKPVRGLWHVPAPSARIWDTAELEALLTEMGLHQVATEPDLVSKTSIRPEERAGVR